MAHQTSIDRLLAAKNYPGFDKILSRICNNCQFRCSEKDQMTCQAISVITGMMYKPLLEDDTNLQVHVLFESLKEAVNKLA